MDYQCTCMYMRSCADGVGNTTVHVFAEGVAYTCTCRVKMYIATVGNVRVVLGEGGRVC